MHVSGLTPADLVEFARVWRQDDARTDTAYSTIYENIELMRAAVRAVPYM